MGKHTGDDLCYCSKYYPVAHHPDWHAAAPEVRR